jgi:acylphosphatase
MMERVHLIVRGIVQGVGFRYHTQQAAAQYGVTGYVRNLPNGTVEIVAEGDSASIGQLIDWAKWGPPSAHVESVDITHYPPTDEFDDFVIRRP